MNRRFRAALVSAVTAAVFVGGAVLSPAAIAAPSTETIVEIDQTTPFFPVNLSTGLGIQVPWGTANVDPLLWQVPLTGTENQSWYVRAAGEGVYTVVSASHSLALERVSTDHGTEIRSKAVNGQANQLWTVRRLEGDLVTIGVPGTDQVLEAAGKTAFVRGVRIGTSLAAPTQQWRLLAANPVSITPVPSRPTNPTGWYNGPVDIALNVKEYRQSSPQPQVQWRASDTSDWADTQSPVTVSSEGKTVLSYRALRKGSIGAWSEGTTVIQIDSLGPEVSAKTTPESGTVAVGDTVSAVFSATDATSGVDHIEYSVDRGAWVTGDGVAVSEAGTHTVDYRAVDTARNVGTTKTLTLTVRAATATPTIASADPSPADGWYQNDASVTLVAPEAGQKIQYRLYGGDWKKYTSPVKVARNGVSTLESRLVVEKQPVAGSDASITVKVDKVVPTATATRTPSSGNGTPRKPVSLSFVAKDLHSGVSKVEYRVNAGAWVTASAAPVVFDKIGSYTVEYRVTDVAGNVSAVRSVPVTITTK